MKITEVQRETLRSIAKDVIDVFESVEAAARRQMDDDSGVDIDSLVPTNTFTSPALLGTLHQMTTERSRAAQVLIREPAVARVEARTKDGQLLTYYICRVMPPTIAGRMMVSYRAPAGRMAALAVGDEFVLPNGVRMEVSSNLRMRPEKGGSADWDAVDARYDGEPDELLTVDSLRAFLGIPEAEAEDLLAAILAAEDESAAVHEGLRRSVLTKMGLRDQPVLDRFQDHIFRLPLASRVLLLGPPGTGKTTTLIRCLGQKLESIHLDEAEKSQVARMESEGAGAMAQAWIMFTPTRLLQQYVKEAFAREGIPASERQIRTWAAHRRILARDVLRILRSPSGGGTFVLKDDAEMTLPNAREHPTKWFSDFDEWQRKDFLDQLLRSAEELAQTGDASVASLAKRPIEILSTATTSSIDPTLEELVRESRSIRDRISELKQASDSRLRDALNLQLNKDRDFLGELARFIDTLQEAADDDLDDSEDNEEADDDEVRPEQRTALGAAAQAYTRALRALARVRAQRRALRKGGRNARVVEWIGERGMPDASLLEVGTSLLTQASARRLSQPVGRYLQGIPIRYRAFRRAKSEHGTWYPEGVSSPRDLDPLELDLIVLAILRAAQGLLQRPGVRRAVEEPEWNVLRSIREQMKMQVLVDEATDFSAIQLGCMAALAHRESRSFFACGDFNQRLTSWGVQTREEFEWACPGVATEQIATSYRQSTQLNELSRSLIRLFGGDETAAHMPSGVESSAVSPVLAEDLPTGIATADWLAARIREISTFAKQLPSIAVLVGSEAEVEPMAELLREALSQDNVAVEACKDGQAVGMAEQVRVFDVQHIKGLEFEAVFFVGVDELGRREPGLFDKYLYVGSTRAATYLGLICSGSLPIKLNGLRPQFVPSWS